jgi:hypothetical protein
MERKSFIVRAKAGILPASGPIRALTEALLKERMPMLAKQLDVLDAVRVGEQSAATRVYLTVSTLEQAEVLVHYRSLLKGTGVTVFDVLSPMERKLHRQLWPRFLEAVAAGKKAQFNRAKLTVDGIRVWPGGSVPA